MIRVNKWALYIITTFAVSAELATVLVKLTSERDYARRGVRGSKGNQTLLQGSFVASMQ